MSFASTRVGRGCGSHGQFVPRPASFRTAQLAARFIVYHVCRQSGEVLSALPFRVGEQESYSSGQALDNGARSEKMSVRKGALLGVSKVFVDTIFSERR